jgi:mono/diheme cytochrome c family protein
MNRSVLTLTLLLGGLAISPSPEVRADDAPTLWRLKVQPLFDVQCVKCHGPIERKSGLALDAPEGILQGGDEGAVVVPGDPDRSRLYQYLDPKADPHMPPKKQLSDTERQSVRDWIAAMKSTSNDKAANTATPTPTRSFGSATESIDAFIAAGWERAGAKPAPGLDDRTWCRRLYLDLAGRIPTSTEVDAFLALPSENRRSELTDRLLASEEYAVRMRELWDVFLMGRTKREAHEDRRRQNGWWTYLETVFRTNRPWNVVVRELLAARPSAPESKGSSWFLYERRNDAQVIAEAVAPVVYGAKIDCAQCHDHPLAREIKQAHYWGLVAAYNRGKNIEGGAEIAESAIGGFANFTNLKKESQPAIITLLNGTIVEETRPSADAKEQDRDDLYLDPKAKVRVPKFSRREAFADAATRDNPQLARAFVNRLWSVLIGRGLVHPVDEMTARNVPSHPELLTWLSEDFARSGYDIRRLVRGAVLSRVYALGWSTDGAVPPSPETFAVALERPLTAEQLARSWRVALGWAADDQTLRRTLTAALPDVLPKEYQATFQQAQFLTYSPALGEQLKSAPGTTLERLEGAADPAQRTRDAFQTVLGRTPDAEEATKVQTFLAGRPDAASANRDLLWSLVTSAEFLTTP